MRTFRLYDQIVTSSDPSLQLQLREMHASRARPACLCIEPPLEMYVAKVEGLFHVKRMPDTGASHAPHCESYEPPAELSGIGEVLGTAIQENPDDGITALKFSFSLTKGGTKAPPVATGAEADTVKTDTKKLTLRSVLHYLWKEAGFNRWTPAMHNKRNWFVVRKYLLQAAQSKTAKGAALGDLLYIPESFTVDKKDEIDQRRLAQMKGIIKKEKGLRQLMLVIGEIKEIAQSRYGYKIVLKHLPDCHFMVAEDLYKRLVKRFALELEFSSAYDDTHLVLIGTFSVGPTGIPSLDEVALMTVTSNWIPVESEWDKKLIDALTKAQRSFSKCLRYNLPSTRPLACLVASDTVPAPTAMYLVPPDASDEYPASLQQLIADSALASWVWQPASETMPALPATPPQISHPS